MATAQGIRAGQAFVELYADRTRFDKDLKSAASTLTAWSKGVMVIGAGIAGLGLSMALPFLALAKSFAEVGAGMIGLAKRTGFSVEALSALSYAASQTGVDMEGLESGIKHMQRLITMASEGAPEAVKLLRMLGLSFEELANLTPEKQLDAVLAAIKSFENPTQRVGLAMQVFGREGSKLIPLIDQAGETLGQAKTRTENFGKALAGLEVFMKGAQGGGGELAATLAELGLSFDDLRQHDDAGQLALMGEKLLSVEDPAKRAALAQKLFGDAGKEVVEAARGAKENLAGLPSAFGEAAKAADNLGDFLEAAAAGGIAANDTLAGLGLTLDELQGMPADQRIDKIASALLAVEDPARRAALAQRIFGDEGERLLSVAEKLKRPLGDLPGKLVASADAAGSLADFLDKAARGSDQAAATLADLDLTLEGLQGMSADKQLDALAAKLAGVEDPAARARIAVEVFGKDAGDMIAKLSAAGSPFDDLAGKLPKLTAALSTLHDTMARAGKGAADAADTLEELGLTVEGLQSLPAEKQLDAIAGKLAGVEDPARRAALAEKILGANGEELFRSAVKSSGGLDALKEKAIELGVLMSTSDANAAKEFEHALSTLTQGVKMTGFQLGAALAPALTSAAALLSKGMKSVIDFARNHRTAVVAVVALGAALFVLGSIVVGFGLTFVLVGTAISLAISGIIGAIGFLKVSLALLYAALSPILLIVAPLIILGVLVTALGAYIVAASRQGQAALGRLAAGFRTLAAVAGKAFAAIGDALAAGEIELAAQILWQSLKVIWWKGLGALYLAVTDFNIPIMDRWDELYLSIFSAAVSGWAIIAGAWLDGEHMIMNGLDDFQSELSKQIIGIQAEFQKLKARADAALHGRSAEAEVKVIEEAAADAKDQVDKDRQGRQDTRQAERQKIDDDAKASIEEKEGATVDARTKRRTDQQKAGDAFKNRGGNEENVLDGMKEIAAARKKAFDEKMKGLVADPAGLHDLADKKAEAHGTFITAAVNRLGRDSTNEKIEKNTGRAAAAGEALLNRVGPQVWK